MGRFDDTTGVYHVHRFGNLRLSRHARLTLLMRKLLLSLAFVAVLALVIPTAAALSLEPVFKCTFGYGFDCPQTVPHIITSLAAIGLVTVLPCVVVLGLVAIYLCMSAVIAIIHRRP